MKRSHSVVVVFLSVVSLATTISSPAVSGPEAQVVTKGAQSFWRYLFGKSTAQAGNTVVKRTPRIVKVKPAGATTSAAAKAKKENGSLSETWEQKQKEYEAAKTYDDLVCPDDVKYKDQRFDCKEAQKRSFKPVREKLKQVITGTTEKRSH